MSEAIGVYELLLEWGTEDKLDIVLQTDSSAAKGTLTRRGSGKVKHLTTKQLWVQEAIRTYKVKVEKINRSYNSADLLTHQCGKLDFNDHLTRIQAIRP